MSVNKTADDVVDLARQKVQEALEAVNAAHTALSITPCWGAEEWKDDFKVKVAKATATLLEVKNDLGERTYF